MRVGFDSTMLSLLLHPESRAPNDPVTGKPTEHVEERLRGLLASIQKRRGKIIIPTPSVAEVLTLIGPANGEYLTIINRSKVFEVQPFDEKAAIELAFMNRDIFDRVDRKSGAEPYQKVKVDRQILAICRVARCDTFYTDDGGLIRRAAMCQMRTERISDLSVPEQDRQHQLALEEHDPMRALDPEDELEPDDDPQS